MSRSSAARTEQQKALDNFSQLWLSCEEWDGPFKVYRMPSDAQPIAWIFKRIR